MTAFATFRDLHHGPDVLLLPNAWDAGSARVIEQAGARAIATTSAGVAWSHGYPDGDALPQDAVRATAREILRAVSVPVSVDFEGGYSSDPATVAANVRAIAELGVVGINLEDGAGAPALLARKIEAIKRELASAGLSIFVNARTDVYLRRLAQGEAAIAMVLERARLYREAGTDGLFVPGATDPREIEAIARGTPLPLNLLARPGLPDAAALAKLGVRRLSAGSGIAEMTYRLAASSAAAFLAGGDSAHVVREAAAYGPLNAAFRA